MISPAMPLRIVFPSDGLQNWGQERLPHIDVAEREDPSKVKEVNERDMSHASFHKHSQHEKSPQEQIGEGEMRGEWLVSADVRLG